MSSKKIIEFGSTIADRLESPVLTKKVVPDWFKKMPSWLDKDETFHNPTIKGCVPFLDTLTSGYLITNPFDVVFYRKEDFIYWKYPRDLPNFVDFAVDNLGIEYHNPNQIAPELVRDDEEHIPFKFLNPWKVTTPKNYSCLFTNPFNSPNREIRIIDGIVDTDVFRNQINFPFFIKKLNPEKSFVLKKGYPIALVFPFLRNHWKMETKKFEKKDIESLWASSFKLFNTLSNRYREKIWNKKNYD